MSYELSEIEIPVGKLKLGMHVVRLDRPWSETEFLIQGFIINNKEIIDALSEHCEYVYIEAKEEHLNEPKIERRIKRKGLFSRKTKQNDNTDSNASVKKEGRQAPPTVKKKVTYINKITTEQEIPASKQAYRHAKTTVKNIMDGIRIGRMLDVNEARQVVDEIVDSVLRNKDALAWLTKIKNKDEYTAEHSLNVSILSATFARHLGHSEEEIKVIALGGLLHDVGKAKIPNEILNKEGRFTDEEFAIMKAHTTYGRNLLMSIPKKDFSTIDIAHSHHERVDGNGYPRQLKEHQIPYYAKIIALTDAYDAITSSRCYDKGRASMEALDIIYKCRGSQFDAELAVEFIKCIGIYPPGSIIELTSGEIAIVISTYPDNKLRPRIIIVLDSDKKIKKQKIVDLKKILSDQEGNSLSISREITNGTYGVKIEDYLSRGLIFSNQTNQL